MKSKASAPGKVILFGEHFVVYGLRAILCAIDKRITVTSELISERKISIKSNIGELELPTDEPIKKIKSPLKPFFFIAKKLISEHNNNSGVKILVESEIPSGVGLGSSSASCVAGAASISRLFENYKKEQVLRLSIEAEKTIFENTSGADCSVCTFGGLGLYDKKNGFSKIDSKSDINLIIVNSMMKHSTKSVVSQVQKFKEKNPNEFSKLCQKESNLVSEVLKMLEINDLKGIGKKMSENQEFLEKIGVSNEKLRELIRNSEYFSLGSKITGAGGGGCIISLTTKENLKKNLGVLAEKNYECFSAKIDFEGLHTF